MSTNDMIDMKKYHLMNLTISINLMMILDFTSFTLIVIFCFSDLTLSENNFMGILVPFLYLLFFLLESYEIFLTGLQLIF